MKTTAIEKAMIDEGVSEENLPRLMAMRISSLALEQVQELKNKIKETQSQIDTLSKTEPGNMYQEDLKTL